MAGRFCGQRAGFRAIWNAVAVRDDGDALSDRDPHQLGDVSIPESSQAEHWSREDEPVHLDTEQAEVLTAEPSHATIVTSTAPVAYYVPDTSVIVAHAVEDYQRALASLVENPSDKSQARRYYTTLAQLAELTWEHQSELGQKEIAEICQHSNLMQLISAAAPSWLQWSGRESAGIVVVGQVQSVAGVDHGWVVTVRANDRNSSEISLLLPQGPRPNETSRSALFYGVLASEDSAGSRVIHARSVPGSL